MQMIGMLAETFIHPGSGQTAGGIDLPVARERTTYFPFIAGSSMKGALRHEKFGLDDGAYKRIFGPDLRTDPGADLGAGSVLVSDARLLLLPLRNLNGAYRWATCPLILERFERDYRRCFRRDPTWGGSIPKPEPGKLYTKSNNAAKPVFLEERKFNVEGNADSLVQVLQGVIADAQARSRLADQLAVLDNDDFAWFCRYGLQVNARNQLDENKTSKNLWYEETLPPDTVMYVLLANRATQPDDAKMLAEKMTTAEYVQIGGNLTVGQGWFHIAPVAA